MTWMFYSASSFNQDLSNRCVSKITSEPQNFSTSSPLSSAHKPRWGTCPARPFITTWRTTGANQTITIPGYTGEAYNYTIDWGDGTVQTAQTAHSPSHSYASAGDHQVKIYGAFPRIYCFNGSDGTRCRQLRSVDQWGDNVWTSMENAFNGARDLQILARDIPNLRRVKSMHSMFAYCTHLTGNFNGWDTSNVEDMQQVFHNASNFNQPLNSWNLGKVKTLRMMFY